MKTLCPNCHNEIPPDQINASDIAFCPHCPETHNLSDILSLQETGDLGDPPNGTWFTASLDEWEVGSTTRSAAAFTLIPHVIIATGLILVTIVNQIIHHKFGVHSLLEIPLFVGTGFLVWHAAMRVCGHVRVRCTGDNAELFTGIGSLGRRRRFRWSQIQGIIDRGQLPNSRKQMTRIRLEGPGITINFGKGLTEIRLLFLISVLRRMRLLNPASHLPQ